MFSKINISTVLRKHFATLKNDNTQKLDWDDYLLFLVLPIFISIVLIYFDCLLSDQLINIVVSSLSILVGLLFNIIVLLFDIIKRDSQQKIKNEILKEILANISFTIFISLISIIITLISYINIIWLKVTTNAILYFLLCLFFLTVLMILKRMFKLFENEMDSYTTDTKSS